MRRARNVPPHTSKRWLLPIIVTEIVIRVTILDAVDDKTYETDRKLRFFAGSDSVAEILLSMY